MKMYFYGVRAGKHWYLVEQHRSFLGTNWWIYVEGKRYPTLVMAKKPRKIRNARDMLHKSLVIKGSLKETEKVHEHIEFV